MRLDLHGQNLMQISAFEYILWVPGGIGAGMDHLACTAVQRVVWCCLSTTNHLSLMGSLIPFEILHAHPLPNYTSCGTLYSAIRCSVKVSLNPKTSYSTSTMHLLDQVPKTLYSLVSSSSKLLRAFGVIAWFHALYSCAAYFICSPAIVIVPVV